MSSQRRQVGDNRQNRVEKERCTEDSHITSVQSFSHPPLNIRLRTQSQRLALKEDHHSRERRLHAGTRIEPLVSGKPNRLSEPNGGPGGFSHLCRVAVPQSSNGSSLNKVPRRSGMSSHETSRKLLGDANVARWHANLGEGSETTADTYLRSVCIVCVCHALRMRLIEGFLPLDRRFAF